MGKKKLVEDSLIPVAGTGDVSANVIIDGDVKITGPGNIRVEAVSPSPVPGVQDPTRNPDTVEGSIFPQIPAEVKGTQENPVLGNASPVEGEAKIETVDLSGEAETEVKDKTQGELNPTEGGESAAEESYEDYTPTADQVVKALDEILGTFYGPSKLELVQRVEALLKQHKSKM